MRQVNTDNVKEAGDFERLAPGGYVCKIVNVVDVPMNPSTEKGDYLWIDFDIAEGEFKGYYARLEENLKFWGGKFIRSYKENALPMFKRMCSVVTNSNPGFVFDGGRQNSDEKTLVGKFIGLVLGEEEYMGNDGNLKTRLYVVRECAVDEIRAGKYRVPEQKKLSTKNEEGFVKTAADPTIEVPFS